MPDSENRDILLSFAVIRSDQIERQIERLALPSFYGWLIKQWAKIAAVLLPIGAGLAFFDMKMNLPSFQTLFKIIPAQQKTLLPNLAHIMIMLIMLLIVLKPLDIQDLPGRIKIATVKFYDLWRMLLLTWILIYMVDLVSQAFVSHVVGDRIDAPETTIFLRLLSDVFNNLSSMIAFLLYYHLSMQIETKSLRTNILTDRLPYFESALVVVTWTVIETVLVLSDAEAMNYFERLGGLAAGACLAAFISRLDSPFVKLPREVFFFLMMYACLQMAWAYDGTFSYLFGYSALAGKIVLFLVIGWLFDTGLVAWHLQTATTVSQASEWERRRFFYGRNPIYELGDDRMPASITA